MRKLRFSIILGTLLAGVILAAFGNSDGKVGFSSLRYLWSDTARDADQIGLRLTRLTDADEMALGAEVSDPVLAEFHEDPAASAYVTDVARSLLPHVRRGGIQYRFHVIGADQINAFAMPGGQIFVTSGLLEFVESEAELASVLGHEISHVDLRHCVERYQYQYRLKKAGASGLGSMVDFAHRLMATAFTQDQESDADAQGEQLAIEAGYDPDAAASLFERLKKHLGEPSPRSTTTPVEELGKAVGEAIGSYFRTHPPTGDRAVRLKLLVAEHSRDLKGRRFYVGKQNLAQRTARSHQEFPAEFRTL
jgi:predicted Zn-dependent protease